MKILYAPSLGIDNRENPNFSSKNYLVHLLKKLTHSTGFIKLELHYSSESNNTKGAAIIVTPRNIQAVIEIIKISYNHKLKHKTSEYKTIRSYTLTENVAL
jgi:hypothetical protein